MILKKSEDLNFCKHISEDGQSFLGEIIRRLSISTSSDGFMERNESSCVRSLLYFTNNGFAIHFGKRILTKYRLLKVLDYESASLWVVPKKLGNLIHLKYLSFRNGDVREVPKSIGMLQNLETLDVRATFIRELPKEISRLRKLRHLIGTNLSLNQLKDSVGEMTSLQTLRDVNLDVDGAIEIIKELAKLKQIRDLGLVNFPIENGIILSSSINEMQHLEKLNVQCSSMQHWDLISAPIMLRKLTLCGRLEKLPEWILELQNLVVLRLMWSYLTKDPMQSLKCLQNLLILSIQDFAYEGLCLHFQDGWFQKLKELDIGNSDELSDIIIEKGALPSLKKLQIKLLPKLKNIPTGIQHLEKLEALHFRSMQVEFVQQNSSEEYWNWIIEHVPLVEIHSKDGKVIRNSRS